MRRKRMEIMILTLTLAVGLLAAVNSRIFFSRFDWTENNIFTISQVSKDLFQEAEEPIRAVYYVSDKLRDYSEVPTRVEDMLREYAAHSRGRLSLEVVDPVAAGRISEVEQAGIQPQQIQVREQDQQSVVTVYTGIVLEYMDRRKVIPVAAQTETLEYDLTSRLRRLIRNETKTVGVLIGEEGRSLERDFSFLRQVLAETYQVKAIERGAGEIASTVDVLMVLGNKDLTESDARRVDSYLMRGGRVFFGAEGVAFGSQSRQMPQAGDDPLLDLLEEYGVEVEPVWVQDQYGKVVQYQSSRGPAMGRYSLWFQVAGRNVSSDSLVTSPFTGLDLFWASPLRINPEAQPEMTILAKSSPQAWPMEKRFQVSPERVGTPPPTPEAGEQFNLMLSAEGRLSSAFPEDGSEDPGAQGDPGAPDAVENARFLVLGDADFASGYIQTAESPYNLDFAAGAVQWLANEEDLLSIKNRSARDRTLSAIQDPSAQRSWVLFTYIVNLVLVPLLVILLGVSRYISRRSRGKEGKEREEA